MPTTTCGKPLWQMTHPPRHSMIPNATASVVAASGYLSTGTMGLKRSTRAISAKGTVSSYSKSADHHCGGVRDEPERNVNLFVGLSDSAGNCVFPAVSDPVQGRLFSRQPLSGWSAENTGTRI